MGFEGSLKGSLSGAIRKGCKLYWVQYCVIGVINGLVQGFSQCTLQDLIVVYKIPIRALYSALLKIYSCVVEVYRFYRA